jgi:hypothetical protein
VQIFEKIGRPKDCLPMGRRRKRISPCAARWRAAQNNCGATLRPKMVFSLGILSQRLHARERDAETGAPWDERDLAPGLRTQALVKRCYVIVG